MFKTQAEMEAIAVSAPQMRTVMNPVTLNEDPHLLRRKFYYKRRNQVRMIMCTQLDTVRVGEPVLISYHSGMRCYQHSRHVVIMKITVSVAFTTLANPA